MRAVSGTKKRLVETPSLRPYFGDQTRPESAQAAQARAEGRLLLTEYTELADLGTSNLPVNIILMPEDQR